MTKSKTQTTTEHKFTAKILVTNTTRELHNDPRRGYKHFATDIQDLIELDINADVAKEIEKVEVTYLRPDLENPNSHYASIFIETVYAEDTDIMCAYIAEILEYRVTEVDYILQGLTEVPEEGN